MDKLNQVGDGGDNWGKFPQSPKIELLPGGRNIRLLEDFVYIDPDGRSWSTPKSYEADGASIPQAFGLSGLDLSKGNIGMHLSSTIMRAIFRVIHLMMFI